MEVKTNANREGIDFELRLGSFMETTGYCQKGDACTFAHSAEELQNAEGSCLAEFDEHACAFARPQSKKDQAAPR